MNSARRGAMLFGLVFLLGACGPKSAATSSPSPSGEPLALAGTTLPTGEVGVGYAGAALEASGGVLPYTYQVVEGTFAPGLALSASGVVVGTPTLAGDFSFSIVVADFGGHAVSAVDSIDIVPALAFSASHSGTVYVESGCDTACGGFATQTGGLAPYKYALKSGNLPAGTSLGEGSLTGKFTSPGTYNFAVQVTDALGATAVVSPTFSVIPHIYFYCLSPWTDPRSACASPGASGSYNGGLTFSCTQVLSHPICGVSMPFAGGSGSGWTVTYRVVAGDQPPTGSGFSLPDPNAAPPPQYNAVSATMVAPSTLGATASGTLLLTVWDGMVCGSDGKTQCSTSAYLTWSVQKRV